MKILVISDTHGETSGALRLIKQEKPDHLIHLGDCLRDGEEMARTFPTLPICMVPGNNDWFTDEPKEKTIVLGGTRIFLCHGHTTGVKNGTDVQWAKAMRQGCTLSLFGHTHSLYLEEREGVLLVNPGSLAYGDTYALLTVRPGKKPLAELKKDD